MKPVSLALLLLAISAANPAFSAQAQAREPAPPLVGGFQKADVTDKAIRAAADFAISAAPKKMTLKQIVSARQQVVAGMDYSLCLRVAAPKFGLFKDGRLVAAKVFQGLDGSYELTSWQDVKTCD
ncbi:cystatin domain-containing protein [Asticcacaulis benevestitus]|uniref:Cystatin domain-containing protein n=1 Tax=Asticcacaulis benevestitus DSM 16100 = ATCC BAA-896 TaxID=1121022 RepID=V4PMX1_9CAUL|nr:cystatin domain-containing protein [Asticcacaulis benevestitus]ESQ86835.1 hypothetical protein ABENE_17935 [Asticcacaulis benevestitus DSM 16100 = ATCC BAA-896]